MIQDALREISLCDTESIWFYRPQEFLFFELLAKRFCQREKSIYGLLDVGKISMDPKTKRDYASNYHLDPDEILAVYKEKKRKHNIIITNNSEETLIFINGSWNPCLELDDLPLHLKIHENKVYVDDTELEICISDNIVSFLNECERLNDMEMEITGFHPVLKETYAVRNDYMKVILLFLHLSGGMTSEQICFVSWAAETIGVDAVRFKEFIELENEISRIKTYKLIDETVKSNLQNAEVQETMLTDFCYLISAGNYYTLERERMINLVKSVLRVKKNDIYRKINFFEKEFELCQNVK